LLLGLSLACQKREYPVFQHPPLSAYSHPKARSAPAADQPGRVTTQSPVASPQLAASTSNDVASVIEPTKSAYAAATLETATKITKASAEPVWQEEVIIKKIQKRVEKVKSSTKAAAPKAKADTVSLLSLIFGGAGLFLLLTGGGLGLVLGLAGLIMGIIGYSTVNRGAAPRSSQTMAILGIIFGGIVTLLAILIIAVIASGGFTFA